MMSNYIYLLDDCSVRCFLANSWPNPDFLKSKTICSKKGKHPLYLSQLTQLFSRNQGTKKQTHTHTLTDTLWLKIIDMVCQHQKKLIIKNLKLY